MKLLRRVKSAAGLVAAMLALSALLGATAMAATPLVGSGAPLPENTTRIHPDPALALAFGSPFSVYTGTDMPIDWTLWDQAVSVPQADGSPMDVTIYSQVWEHTDGHYLFAYKVQNNGTIAVRNGNITGYELSTGDVIDSGVLDIDPSGGDTTYDAYDVLRLARQDGGAPQLAFYFWGQDSGRHSVEKLLPGGQSSNWFYAETTATTYGYNDATVLGSGTTKNLSHVLTPTPEPATLALVGTGALVALIRRRRGR